LLFFSGECSSDDDTDASLSTDEEQENTKGQKKKTLNKLHPSPSKRISLKGETLNLEHMFSKQKKRKMALEFSGLSSKAHSKNFKDTIDGIEGRYISKEV
jgi:hypothetical protein